MSGSTKISFIGFGEAAQAFAKGLLEDSTPVELRAFDIKTDGPDAAAKRADYVEYRVDGTTDSATACSSRDVIYSLVTAEEAENAARSAGQTNLTGALFFDCNSCAPETKRRAAKIIEDAGGRYVDVAVMTPVHPRLHKSPCLLAGPHAEAAADIFDKLGMSAKIAGPDIGDASTRKMIRSVMIKGLEALTLECFLAARKAGIEGDILASLETSYPGFDWQSRAPYMMERAATHGIRRASEMEEVAKTLTDLGIEPHVTQGTIVRQREVGTLGLDLNTPKALDLAARADAILTGLANKPATPNSED